MVSLKSNIFFPTPADLRGWFERHHATAEELWLGFHKKGSGEPSVTWPESVDAALCYGWIDGVRKNIDATRYQIRFTPRRKGSIWSTVNVNRVAELTKLGLMRPEGLRAFEARTASKTGIYTYEQKNPPLFRDAHLERFRGHSAAWQFFEAQPPSYRRVVTGWVTNAKKEETSLKRLKTLMDACAEGRRLR